jgi:ribosome-binding factor A
MGVRSERVQAELKREISMILQEDLKDPRIGFVTVTRVDITGDLRYAKVYFSILGNEKEQNSSIQGIESAVGYIRKLIAERLGLRYAPELSFRVDKSIEYSINLERTFKRLRDESKEH